MQSGFLKPIKIIKHEKMEEKMILGKVKGSTIVFMGMMVIGVYLIVMALII